MGDLRTTLVIMAAGIGSRFGGGGLKQLSKIDEAGNIIMDYSVYDAVEAGFEHVVFVIRRDTCEQFREVIGNRIEAALAKRNVKVSYVFQELEDLPQGMKVPEGRTKPWGTGQAVLACKGTVDGPFLMINADDYYGKDCFVKLHRWLIDHSDARGEEQDFYPMAMAGFVLKNTVSENGAVTRGVCQRDERGTLARIIETKEISIQNGQVCCANEEVQKFITPDTVVSMNMWAAYPEFLDYLEEAFIAFLKDGSGDPMKKEYLIPEVVGDLLKAGKASVSILDTDDKWIGITYKEDLPGAREEFARMIADGKYEKELWKA